MWVNVTETTGSARQAADLTATINMAIRFGLLATAVIWALNWGKALWRMLRRAPDAALA
jgi:hypothetical protein